MTENRSDSHWRRINPVVVFTLLLIHAMILFLWENPLLLAGQLCFLLVWAARTQLLRDMPALLLMGWWIGMIYLVINPLFASYGITYLWKGPIVPVIGRLDISIEELGYACMSLLRLVILLVLSLMFQRFVDHDRLLLRFAKLAPRFVLTSVLAIRLFPLLSRELERIKETTRLRGLRPEGASWREKWGFQMVILRPLLLSAMESSWLTAETLYARGFGSGPRSSYKPPALSDRERLGMLLILFALLVALFGRFLSFGRFSFYPRFVWYDPLGDTLFLGLLLVVWTLPLYFLTRRQYE